MANMSDDEIAALAGFTVAFFKSNKELWSIFQKAKSGQWDSARILSAVRGTKWFKKNNEAQRQLQLLKTSDPAEYKRRLAEQRARVTQIQRETGLGVSVASAKTKHINQRIAALALANNWNDQQIRNALGNYNTVQSWVKNDSKFALGMVGQAERMIRTLARDYGISVSNGSMATMARNFALGKTNEARMRDWFITKAKSRYAGVAHEIDSGLTVRQIAEPYMDSMARLWEINREDIGTRNSWISKALSGNRNKDGKPEAQPIWQFEQALREAPQWRSTNNAREALFGVGHKVLQDMGLVV